MKRTVLFACFILVAGAVHAFDWSTNLVWDGGGVWTKRLPVTIENRDAEAMAGKPVAVKLPLSIPTGEIRVTKSDGQEVVYAILSGGNELLVPVDCEPSGTTTYYVYFGNEKSEVVPDYLAAKGGFVNGDLELGEETMPDGWTADPDDQEHRNFWTDEKPHSGKKCLKTTIEKGVTPSWFAVRQSGFPVIGGAKYRFSAWVRGENVEGRAGWFLHVGNEKNSQLINSVREVGGGTFDWKEIAFEFTVPKEADLATVGTVLYGTGTAWYDDVTVERIDSDAAKTTEPKVLVGNVEDIPLKIIPAETAWPKDAGDYLCRSTFRIVNASDQDIAGAPVLMSLRGTQAHGLLGPLVDLSVDAGGEAATVLDADNFRISCKMSVPAKTIKYFNVYYRFDESKVPSGSERDRSTVGGDSDTAHPELQKAADLLAGLPNLVKNGDIEAEGGSPEHWNRNDASPPEGVRYSIEKSPEFVRFGKQCLRLDVSKTAPSNWRGWTQRIAVEPNHSYLVQGWLKGIDIETARIHLHFHRADGKHCENGGMSSINQDISGTTDWTRIAEVVTTPPDAGFMTVHLTTNGSGSLLHDNITVVDGLFAEQVDRDSLYKSANAVWQVPAVMKVFPQSIPPRAARSTKRNENTPFRIEAARNEKEPLQIAFRNAGPGAFAVAGVNAPKHAGGFILDRYEVNEVGYVRIDYPSNYYNTKTPKWYRKSPTSAPGCDGWGGLWPDPLLPLKPHLTTGGKDRTGSFWITWTIPKDAPAGKYVGSILLSTGTAPRPYPVEITVRDFTLPDENHVSAIYDVRFGPDGTKYWGKPVREFYPEIVDFMNDNRLSPDSVMPDPKVDFKDGKFTFDWTGFDRAAGRMIDDQKLRRLYTPHLFYSFGWGHPPKNFFGEQPYDGEWPFKNADFSKLRPEYKARYQACLGEFWNHLKEKGWADKFVLYVSDEPNYWSPGIIEQMKAVCAMIHEVDPAIPIYSSTWRYVPEWSTSLDIWGIGHYGIVPVETMEKIKADGSRIWFTTDGMLCLDTPYNAIERLLPYYCFKYGAEAYEFWGVAWLTYNPYEYGAHAYIYQTSTPGEYYWVRYPNGDGYLLYPGKPVGLEKPVSSVRFEQAREGVEDFEYFYMLTQLVEKAKKAGRDVSKAEAVLADVRKLVDCPAPIGRYSSKILPNPNRIYEVRRQVAEAIESLK